MLQKQGIRDARILRAILDDYTLILRTVELGNVSAVDNMKYQLIDLLVDIEARSKEESVDKLLEEVRKKLDTIVKKEYVDFKWSEGTLQMDSLH